MALKIRIPGKSGENEINMQQEIIRTVQDTSNLLTALTTFSLPSPNGDYRVLVFSREGMTLEREMSLETRMSALKQLLKASKVWNVANLRSQRNIEHNNQHIS